MARRRFPPCPHCGAQHVNTKQTTAYSANDGEIPCWDLKCGWCGEHYQAGMFPLPLHASMSALDELVREKRRLAARKKWGYDPKPKFPDRGAKRIESDRIEATVKIRPGHVVKGLRKRLGMPKRTALEVA